MTEYDINIIYTKGDWPWPYWWQVRRPGKFFGFVDSGVASTERGARRKAERAARRATVRVERYTYMVEEE